MITPRVISSDALEQIQELLFGPKIFIPIQQSLDPKVVCVQIWL